jgi:hypothetical protein
MKNKYYTLLYNLLVFKGVLLLLPTISLFVSNIDSSHYNYNMYSYNTKNDTINNTNNNNIMLLHMMMMNDKYSSICSTHRNNNCNVKMMYSNRKGMIANNKESHTIKLAMIIITMITTATTNDDDDLKPLLREKSWLLSKNSVNVSFLNVSVLNTAIAAIIAIANEE